MKEGGRSPLPVSTSSHGNRQESLSDGFLGGQLPVDTEVAVELPTANGGGHSEGDRSTVDPGSPVNPFQDPCVLGLLHGLGLHLLQTVEQGLGLADVERGHGVSP